MKTALLIAGNALIAVLTPDAAQEMYYLSKQSPPRSSSSPPQRRPSSPPPPASLPHHPQLHNTPHPPPPPPMLPCHPLFMRGLPGTSVPAGANATGAAAAVPPISPLHLLQQVRLPVYCCYPAQRFSLGDLSLFPNCSMSTSSTSTSCCCSTSRSHSSSNNNNNNPTGQLHN